MLTLKWLTCGQDGHWCSFDNLDLQSDGVNVGGVYVIWYRGNPGRVVRVGQGIIPDRIAAHRGDAAVTAYRSLGLNVTWAVVPAAQRDGVERYLADLLEPLVGDAFPDVVPLAVNLPW